MLTGVVGTRLEITCSGCDFVYHKDVNGLTLDKNEFNEYQNLVTQCGKCGEYELFNMNIPLDDTGDGVKTGEISLNEEVQRHYVRVVQRLTRADFKKGGDK